jgi:hypothetical protein
MKMRWIMAAVCLAGTTGVGAAPDRTPDAPVARGVYRGVIKAARFDVSPPLRSMRPQPGEEPEGEEDTRDRPSGLEGPLGPQQPDAAVQAKIGGGELPTPSVSFSTVAGTGPTPPDSVGDVGPNHYVVMANTRLAIYSKTGTLLFGPVSNNTLWAGFGGACQTENAGDPVVLHDQLADRWILTQFTAAGPNFFNCVAVSTTGDPTGTYFRYAFPTGVNFPDYPKCGIWPDALYISTREFLPAGPFAGVGAYAVDRAQLIAGNPAATLISLIVPPGAAPYNTGDGLLPADMDGTILPPAGSPSYWVGSMDLGGPYGAPQDALTFWRYHADFVTPANSTFTLASTIPIAAYDTIFPCTPSARACIPQPGTTAKIDILSYRERPLHRLAYRNFGTHESLVTNQSVEAAPGMAGIRWWELRNLATTPTIFQEGTYAPGVTDGVHRWMGSIAMDRAGNMALGFSASDGVSVFPSSRYTGRLAADPLGQMSQGEGVFVAGTGSQTSAGNRWGDYSSMNVDPSDDCTFWYITEYYPATSATAWTLRVGSFKFPSPQCVPSPVELQTFTLE